MNKMHKTYWSLLALLLAGLCFGLAGCNPNPQPEYLTPIPTLAPAGAATLNPALQQAASSGPAVSAGMGQGNAAIGAALFFKHCRTCHGLQGEGIDGPPLRNSQYVQTSGDDSVFSTIADGRSGTMMPAWFLNNGGPLNDAAISNVVAYLHTLQNVSPVPQAATSMGGEEEAPPAANEPPARPSNPGDPGPAATLTGDATKGITDFGQFCSACHGPQGREEVGYPNPGSDDGIVPPLNPIDPTLVDPDPKIFAVNLDLFIEHGSIPSGSSPLIMMPSFGDSNLISDQQIADVIAYLMGLNGVK
jgi:mono/diheme cytochrome c family protein